MRVSNKVYVLLVVTLGILLNGVLCKYSIKKIFDEYQLAHKSEGFSKGLAFNFQNCGPSSDPFRVKSFTLSPDPLNLPGNITFSGEANVLKNVTGPLSMTLKIIKVIGPMKVELPCVDNFGSCTYQDLCAMLPTPDNCPEFFKKNYLPCSCPFILGDYTANNVQLEVDLPAKIPPGEYIISANLQNKVLGHVGCVQVSLNVAK